jgi:hypothetical protein
MTYPDFGWILKCAFIPSAPPLPPIQPEPMSAFQLPNGLTELLGYRGTPITQILLPLSHIDERAENASCLPSGDQTG